jgi:hypothetical protein
VCDLTVFLFDGFRIELHLYGAEFACYVGGFADGLVVKSTL